MARAKPNAESELQRILAETGADPMMLEGFNPDYVNKVNQLYQNLAEQYAGLGIEEADVGTNFERSRGDLIANQARARTALRDRLASRGMLESTTSGEQQEDLERGFESQLSDLGSAKNRSLQDIIARRLGYENQYDLNLGGYNTDLATQASKFFENKATAARDADLAKQVGQGNSLLGDQQVAAINRQIPAYTPPAIDYSALLSAFKPVTPPAPPKPPPPPKPAYATAANPYLADPFGTQGIRPTVPPKPTLKSATKQVTQKRMGRY